MANEMPEPLSALGQGAAMMHELFLAYVAAGFEREDALQIVIAIVVQQATIQRAGGGK